jgi:hypothetical protein
VQHLLYVLLDSFKWQTYTQSCIEFNISQPDGIATLFFENKVVRLRINIICDPSDNFWLNFLECSTVVCHLSTIDAVPSQNNSESNSIPGKHDIKEVQETTILGTAHLLRNVLMEHYETFIIESNIICTTYCKHRILVPATLYLVETWFVLVICFKYPL